MIKFELDETEEAEWQTWRKDQEKKMEGMPRGAISGGYTFSFSPNSIGMVTTVSNELTGDSIDLTDYNLW